MTRSDGPLWVTVQCPSRSVSRRAEKKIIGVDRLVVSLVDCSVGQILGFSWTDVGSGWAPVPLLDQNGSNSLPSCQVSTSAEVVLLLLTICEQYILVVEVRFGG